MPRVLVTGGAGYIGSHAARRLAEAGYEPIVVDNLRTGWRGAVKFGAFEQADILDAWRLRDIFERHQPDAVMHFAALSNVGESVQKPELYFRNNIVGSLTLFDAAREAGCPSIVFSSTCATYGEPDGKLLTEEHPQVPVNPYGTSKLAAEAILKTYSQTYGMRSVIFRYFNVAGAAPSGEIGESHAPETHLIPLVLLAALGRREGITVFGSDYSTRDGTCVRDYIHVEDLVDAHVRGLEHLLAGGQSLELNLGSGNGFTVTEIIDAAKKITGRPILVNPGARRPGDPASLVSGSSLADRQLGWRPQRSIDSMIEDAWRWHQHPAYGV